MSRITSALAVSEFDANMQVITEGYAGNLDAESFQNLQAEMMEQVEVIGEKAEGIPDLRLCRAECPVKFREHQQGEYESSA